MGFSAVVGRDEVEPGAGWRARAGVVVRSEGVEESEEATEPRIPGLEAPTDLAGALDDLARDVDEGVEEGPELHPQQPPALFVVLAGPTGTDRQQQGAPGF